MKWFDNTALTLVIIGALNWLLVGIFKLDIVAVIFGNLTWISRIIYTIIGLCGLYLISFMEESEVILKRGIRIMDAPSIFLHIIFQELLPQLLSYLYKAMALYQHSLQ